MKQDDVLVWLTKRAEVRNCQCFFSGRSINLAIRSYFLCVQNYFNKGHVHKKRTMFTPALAGFNISWYFLCVSSRTVVVYSFYIGFIDKITDRWLYVMYSEDPEEEITVFYRKKPSKIQEVHSRFFDFDNQFTIDKKKRVHHSRLNLS